MGMKRQMGNSQLSQKENKQCLRTHKRLGQNKWEYQEVGIVVVGKEYLCGVGEVDYMNVDMKVVDNYDKKAWQIDILGYKKVCWVF